MAEKRKPMTISLTKELREEMQKHSEVNWSEVARDAFNRRIEEMEQAQNMELSEETVARLVASRERAENKDRGHGYACGKTWAERRATWTELRDMAAASNGGELLFDGWDEIRAACSRDELEHSEIEEWLERELGERYSDGMVAGFVEGALAVYYAMDPLG